MPYPSNNFYQPPNDDQSLICPPNISVLSTQQSSNLSSSNSIPTTSNSIETYASTTDTSNDNTTTDTARPNHPLYNTLFDCRAVLDSKRTNSQSDQDYFKLLYCMYTGCEGSTKTRIQKLVDSKESTVSIRTVKPLKKYYVEELLRRYSYLRIKERGVVVGKNKKFRPTNKSSEEINTLFESIQFQLPTSEKLYLEFEMEPFLSTQESNLKITLNELQHQGSEITKSDLKKMRLWEAIFLDSKYMRDKLISLKCTMTRKQIDARNSKVGPLSLFHLAAEKYNDPNWVVYSRVLPDLNEKFRKPIRLVLMTDEEEMTESSVKNAYTDAKGKLNIALSNWKTSGNGKGNLLTKVRGLDYDNSSSDENQVTFIDDDRFNFVKQLNIAYFWSLSELTGLTHHISQNCSALSESLNNSSDKDGSSTSGKVRGRAPIQENTPKKKRVEEQTEALFAMVSDIKQSFVYQNQQFKSSSLNSQLLDAEDALIKL